MVSICSGTIEGGGGWDKKGKFKVKIISARGHKFDALN